MTKWIDKNERLPTNNLNVEISGQEKIEYADIYFGVGHWTGVKWRVLTIGSFGYYPVKWKDVTYWREIKK